MIDRIVLTNFRKFEKFSLKMHANNILVGPNNSGKSSILDAFRVLEACFRFMRNQSPSLLQIKGEGLFDGYQISERSLPFRLANATHNYSDDDAVLEFWLADQTRAVVRLHPERQTRFYVDQNQSRLTSSAKIRKAFPIDLVIVPTLAPLEVDEQFVGDDTVQRNSTTRLASRVLRNIWYRRSAEEFELLSRDIESAWPTIKLHKPELVRAMPPVVEMFYSEDRIDREVQWSGFGFQVWLQIQTHLRRAKPNSILIIDEPDIYLHPDLQRRLLRDAKERFQQFVMATHAVEIINEADNKDVITITPGAKIGRRVKTEQDYVALFRYLGSSENVDISRIARAKQVIFVEGKDGRLLRRLANRLKLSNLANLQHTPIIQLGGVTEWKRAIHAVWAFRQILEMEISAFCVFDRDYRPDSEVKAFLDSVADEDFECRILNQKEIENYLLVPDAIHKAIRDRLRTRDKTDPSFSLEDTLDLLRNATDDIKFDVAGQRMAHEIRYARQCGSKLDESTILRTSGEAIERAWCDIYKRLEIVPGKEAFSRVNDLLQSRMQISISEAKVAEHISSTTIDPFFLDILKELDAFCVRKSS